MKKAIVSFTMVFSILLTMLNCTSYAEDTNIALAANGTTISCTKTGGGVLTTLIDGKKASDSDGYWSGADNTSPQYVTLTFNSFYDVKSVSLYNLLNGPYGTQTFKFQYLDYNTDNYVDIAEASATTYRTIYTFDFDTITTNSIRVEFTAPFLNKAPRLIELEVYGTAASAPMGYPNYRINTIRASNTGITANVTKKGSSSAILYIAAYKAESLVAVKSFNLNQITGTADFGVKNSLPYDFAKAFFWDNTPATRPLTLSKSTNNIVYDCINILDSNNSDFDNSTLQNTQWTVFGESPPTNSFVEDVVNGGKYLASTRIGTTPNYSSQAIDIFPFIKARGAGTYKIAYNIMLIGTDTKSCNSLIRWAGTGTAPTWFDNETSGSKYTYINKPISTIDNNWHHLERTITVSEGDIASNTQNWTFCLDMIAKGITSINIDDFELLDMTDR